MNWLYMISIPFICSLCLTPLVKYIANYLNVCAQVNERTVHKKPLARIGGVAIFVGFFVGMLFFMKLDNSLRAILVGGYVMFIGGVIDDMYTLKPLYKLLFQFVAASIVILWGGITLGTINLPMNIVISMGGFSVFMSYVWIIGITNAINLIDGLDGLAGGISTIVLMIIGSLSIIDGRTDIATISFLLAGSTCGFLVYNMHPASIFMGDCGALFLGFMISTISLMGFQSSTFITLGLPILMLGIPIFDTLIAIIRRAINGQKFTSADKNHLHHVLMRKFGHQNTVLILYVVTLLFGLSAYAYIFNKVVGLSLLIVITILVEIFIEVSGMISNTYHPLLGIFCLITKKRSVLGVKALKVRKAKNYNEPFITPEK